MYGPMRHDAEVDVVAVELVDHERAVTDSDESSTSSLTAAPRMASSLPRSRWTLMAPAPVVPAPAPGPGRQHLGQQIGGTPRAAHVVHPQHATAEGDPEGVGGHRRQPALPHLEAEDLAEESLVRRREQDRIAKHSKLVGGPQQL